MIDQYMRNLESDLGKLRQKQLLLWQKKPELKRELNECTEEQINKMQTYAEKALMAGNESDARTFLEKSNRLSIRRQLFNSHDIAKNNADKMRQMHDKLVKDIQNLESRRTAIKATVKAAKAQERINKVGSSVTGANNSMEAFSLKWRQRQIRCLMKQMRWQNLIKLLKMQILTILQQKV